MVIDRPSEPPIAAPVENAGLARSVLVALLFAVPVVLVRVWLEQLVSGVPIFSLVFPAVAAATLLAGWQSGLVVVLICQISLWYLVLPPYRSFAIPNQDGVVTLLVGTAAQLVLLLVAHAYRQSRQRIIKLEELRSKDLKMALRELDHRTMNNFLLAIAVLKSQARRHHSPAGGTMLDDAIGRLNVLASAHRALQDPDGDLFMRPLGDMIEQVLVATRAHSDGLKAVAIETQLEPVDVPAEHAVRVGLVLNELVTNALKYAFPHEQGTICVTLRREGAGYCLRVADDGVGYQPSPDRSGTGSKLLPMLAKSVGGALVPVDGPGTIHELRVQSIPPRVAHPRG